MIRVNVYKQSNYPVSAPKIKQALKAFLKNKGITSDAEVSVAIIDEKKMKRLGKKYLKEDGKGVHNVLSFTEKETKKDFKQQSDGIIRLGEIVICFPKLLEETKKEDKLIDEKATELVEHGAMHLLGIHHE